MAGELAAEWIRIPDGNGNLQKVWVRDSTARRDIAQLQTDVSGKADAATTLAGYGITDAYTKTQVDGMIPSVPSAYTSNPAMDGTASPGLSTAWARGDHVHPHDSTKADVSAIPTKTSDLTNDSGFITSAPVISVNGQTGAVSLTASDVGALPSSTTIPTKTSDLTNDSGFITSASVPTKTSDLTNDSGFITASAVPDPSSAAPAMDGTAAAGSSDDYARADHVHPSDTAKQDALTSTQLAAVNSGITANDLAVNNASVVCSATKIVPTLTNGTARASYGGVYYYKIGSRVTVHVGVEGLTASENTVLFTLPAGYYNTDGDYGWVGIGSSMGNYCRMRIDQNGIVRVSSSGVYGCVTASYDVF